MPPAHHGGGHGVVDEKHADQQRDERKRGEVELERAEHSLDLPVAAVGRLDDNVGGQFGSQARADGVEIGAGPQQRRDAAELAHMKEVFLHVGDVHDGEVLVGAGGIVAEIEDVTDVEGLGAGLGLDAKRITDLEMQAVGKTVRQGDHPGVAQELDDIGLLPLGVVEFKGAERAVGENIDAEELQVFAGEIGEAGDVLDGGRGGGDIGIVRDDGIGVFVEAEAVAGNFEFGFARDDVDRGPERFERAVIDDLNAEKNRDPQRDAHDVQRRQRRMSREVAQAVGEEEAEHFLTEWTELRRKAD